MKVGPAAVLFDLDGTLVDSAEAHGEAYSRTFADFGLELSPRAFAAHAGAHHFVIIERLLDGRDPGVPLQALHARKTEHFAQTAADLVRPLPLLGLVHSLQRDLPIGLVTGATSRTTGLLLAGRIDADVFAVTVTADDVALPKPDPEPYRRAVQFLGVEASEVVVFEDSESGIASGRAAGCQVVAVAPPDLP